ncbi:MAG: bifunctional folylpolyglutamate synthase/dihydrofolate synthase [Gammaproteobacteria bacterium]|nr:bifunctional folylpolyglutamate synthase/dihydrofolate synthase [Gammaproteobacteria bacterium]
MSRSGSFQTLDEWLAWLSTLTPNEIELGLDRTRLVLDRLALRRPALVIHVAGTNGKGSCVIMLEAFLRRSGLRVGAYISPHLQKYNERIRVDGVDCGDQEIMAAMQRVEACRQDLPLTYFEFGTLAAFCVFEHRQVDAVVLEIGMGGRLDAVNALDPDGGIITNISLDHCEWLGHDVESIGFEKAGILRRGRPFIFGAAGMPQSVRQQANEVGANLLVAGTDFRARRAGGEQRTWTWEGRRISLAGLNRPALAADVQIDNAAAVLAMLEALGLDELLQRDLVNEVLGSLVLPGRLQTVFSGREWLLDVAHNAGSAAVLAQSLSVIRGNRRVVAVIGMLQDKDAAALIGPLCPVVDSWIAVPAVSGRARPASELASVIAQVCQKPCLITDDVGSALRAAEDRAGDSDIALVCGSFYVVGPALDTLYSRRQSGPTPRNSEF